MHTKNSLLDNARSRKGARLIPVGGPTISPADLLAVVRFLNALRIEIHFANGDVLFNTTGSMEVLLYKAKQLGGDFRIIALPPESTNFPHINSYGKITMDEQAARESVIYPPRFPFPAVLESILTSGRPITLVPDDYLHRLPEIAAALAKVDEPATAKAIATFAARVELYKAGEMKIDGPHSTIFTTKEIPSGYIGEDTLAIISIAPPQIAEIAPAPREIPFSRPLGINVPAQPRVPYKINPPSPPPDAEEFTTPDMPPVSPAVPPPTPTKVQPAKTPTQPDQTMLFDF